MSNYKKIFRKFLDKTDYDKMRRLKVDVPLMIDMFSTELAFWEDHEISQVLNQIIVMINIIRDLEHLPETDLKVSIES